MITLGIEGTAHTASIGIVDEDGSLMGQMAKVRMTPNDKANMLRSKFKLINTLVCI